MATDLEFSSHQPRNALAIFCRAPRLGTVKTRLAQSLGNEFTLELYRAMLRDSFALGKALAPMANTFAYFTPNDALEGEESLRDFWDGPTLAQCDGDLGARMLHCFAQLRELGYERIVLMGSDSPDLPLQHLQQAFELLDQAPITVGASLDGGFTLLGAAVLPPNDIFQGIVWSSESVLRQLRQNLANPVLGLSFQELPTWHDVDDESDLEALRHRLFELGTHAPRTRDFLLQTR